MKLTRREFVKTAAATAAGTALWPFLRNASATAAPAADLTVLTWSHFVPAADDELRRQAEAFGRARRVTVRVDTLAMGDLPAKLAAEVETQSGHDIVLLMNYSTALFKSQLVPLNDVVAGVRRQYGDFWPFAREASQDVGGEWFSMPWFYTPAPGNVRVDYFKRAGAPTPDTWDSLLTAAPKLKAIGHPIGLGFGHHGDSNDWLLQCMASFGAMAVDNKGRVVINSPETRRVLDYVRLLYNTMPPEVIGWGGADNNRWILSGVGSYTINPISIYVAAQRDAPEVARNMDHVPPPAGPKGRFSTTTVYTLGVWRFSRQQALAKEFLRYLFAPANYHAWIEASGGYNFPLMREFEVLPVWKKDPKLQVILKFGAWMHMALWPAPPSGKAQQVYDSYIIPDMFARAVRGASNDDAIAWGEAQLRKIWG